MQPNSVFSVGQVFLELYPIALAFDAWLKGVVLTEADIANLKASASMSRHSLYVTTPQSCTTCHLVEDVKHIWAIVGILNKH